MEVYEDRPHRFIIWNITSEDFFYNIFLDDYSTFEDISPDLTKYIRRKVLSRKKSVFEKYVWNEIEIVKQTGS